MKRRGLVVVLCLAMLISFLPNQASAAEIIASGFCGGEGDGTNLTWELDSNGLLQIRGTGEMKRASWDQNAVTAVIIHPGVTTVASRAFYRCRNITHVELPDTILCIEQDAFQSCDNLTSIHIPESVTEIQYDAFRYSGIASIYIPSNVTNLSPILCCEDLQDITVAPDNQVYKSIDGILYDKSGKKLLSYPAGKRGDFQVPNGVVEIGREAFYGCMLLGTVILQEK